MVASGITLIAGTTPATPAPGKLTVYADASGVPHYVDSAGVASTLVGPQGATGNSLERPTATLTSTAGIVSIDLADGIEVYTLTLTENVTGWSITPPPAGKTAELRVDVRQGDSVAYSCVSPADMTVGGDWTVSSTLGSVEMLRLSISSDGTVMMQPSGVVGLPQGILRIGDLSVARVAMASATPSNPMTILRVGDSTTLGAGAGTATTWTQAGLRNCSAQYATLSGGVVSADSFFGDGWLNAAPGYNVYNTNVTVGSGWSSTISTLGGFFFKFTAGGTGTLRMLLPVGATKVRIYWLGSGASATVQTDIGPIGAMTASAAIARSEVFTVQAGAAYVEIASPTMDMYVNGIAAINATQKAVLLTAGANGAKMIEFTTTTQAYSSLNELKFLAPALTVIAMTINDANGATAPATYRSQLVSIVQAALLSGSVAVELGAISNTTQSTDGTLAAIQSAMLSVADEYNLTVLSLPALIGQTYAAANASGYMFDSAHPNYAGYGVEARGWLSLQHLIGG